MIIRNDKIFRRVTLPMLSVSHAGGLYNTAAKPGKEFLS